MDGVFSLRQQCELLGLNRSGLYYRPVSESDENLALMRLLDEQYTRTPCYGVLRMVAYLRSLGHEVNPKRVRRLLRTMGLEAVYQKPNTSQPNPLRSVSGSTLPANRAPTRAPATAAAVSAAPRDQSIRTLDR